MAGKPQQATPMVTGGKLKLKLVRLLPPLAVIVFSLAAWDLAVYYFEPPRWFLPRIYVIASLMIDRFPYLLGHSAYTFKVIILGFSLGVAVGLPLAVAIAYCVPFERAIYPLLVFSQTVPKIAVAPLFGIWLGLNIFPHMSIAFLISFFPIVIDSVAGLKSVRPEMLSLARSMGASAWQVFWKISVPYALPYIFTGLKVAITLAVVGALVGEWVGSERGLGYVLLVAGGDLNTPMTFAAILMLAAMGMMLFYAIRFIESLLISWHVSERAMRGETM